MKCKKILSALLAITMAAASMAACQTGSTTSSAAPEPSNSSTQQTPPEENKGPIAIIVPAADHGWLAGVSYFAEQKCKELGLAEGTGYKLVTSANVNEQANQIDEMINLDVSAVVLQPHNDEVSVSAKKIVDAGIPLVVFDRKVDVDYTTFVAGDNTAMGEKSAEFIGGKLNGKGIVAVLNVPSSGSVSAERVDGFKKVMGEKYPDMQMVDITAADFTQQEGLKTATDALVANSQLDAIFSIDDESSLGILQAIKDAKRTEIKFLAGGGGGQDYFKKINSETQPECFTATYSPSMIKDAVQAAKDILDGKSVAKDLIVPPDIVTSENVSDYLDENSPY